MVQHQMSEEAVFLQGLKVCVLTLLCISGVAACALFAGLFDTQLQQLLAGEMLTTEETAKLSSVFQDLQESLQIKWSVLIIVLRSCEATTHCLDGDFDSQVRQLLTNEQLTQAEIANLSTVFQDLQSTLQTRWPGSQVFPLGSFVTGLAFKSSDADCMATVPLHDLTHDRHLILEAAHLLKQQPQLYDHIRAKVHKDKRMPLLKFTYIPTKRNCDVNFINNIPRENSRMMGYYFSLDENFLSLAAILKLWSKVHRLKSTKTLSSNTLNLLIIFYLQQQNIAPPFKLLQTHLVRCPANIWETSFKRIPYMSMNTLSLYQLLGGFFKYYSEFNFDEYVVSPLVGRPIHKRLFNDIESLPDELYLYKSYMTLPNSKPMDFRKKMCVQDVIEQRRNTANVAEDKADHFISHVKFAAKVFDVFPKDLFLRVILSEYTSHRHQLNKVLRSQLKISDNFNMTEQRAENTTYDKF